MFQSSVLCCINCSFQVSLTELLDQMETELRLLKEELREHKLADVSGQPETPVPNWGYSYLKNGGYQSWRVNNLLWIFRLCFECTQLCKLLDNIFELCAWQSQEGEGRRARVGTSKIPDDILQSKDCDLCNLWPLPRLQFYCRLACLAISLECIVKW